MKIYIWTGLNPDYTSGLAFAIAEDETQAKKLITKQKGCELYLIWHLEICDLNTPFAMSVGGNVAFSNQKLLTEV